MLFEISELVRKETGSTQEIEINEDLSDIQDKDVILKGLTIGKVILIRTKEGILAQFQIKTKVELICDRCLSKFEKPLGLEFNQEYVLETEKPTRLDWHHARQEDIIEQEEKNEGFVVDTKNRIDFKEALRQGILVSLPIKKLCKQNCQGIKYKG